MKRKREYKSRFFPFSPTLPWKIDRGKYIIPEIDFETWHRALDGRDIVIVAFGGLVESFFSLCVAEALVSFDSSHNVYWLGNSEYLFLSSAQGLCKPSLINLTNDILKKYPVPLFFDNDKNAYFNVLNNYLCRVSYWGKYPEVVKAPIFEQMAKNIMVPWRNYVPKLRNLGTDFVDELCRMRRIHQKAKIVTIILNNNEDDRLNWSLVNLKEFSQLAAHKGLKVIVFTHNVGALYGTNILANKYDIRNILQTIRKSWLVLSNDINWSLISLAISNAKLMSESVEDQYSLLKNAEFLGVNTDIFTDSDLSPIGVFRICEGLL
jgi:hypothetical protein